MTSGDGEKTLQLSLWDGDNNTSTYTGSIILDTLAPTASITSDIVAGTPARSIVFALENMSSDIDTDSITWTNTFDNTEENASTYTLE